MPEHFDLIVFDWDGTLADSTRMIVDCIQAASRDAELQVPERSAVEHIIGLGLHEAIAALFGELTEAQFQQLVARYRYHYYARDEETPLFANVFVTIAELKKRGFKLAVATGKGRNGLNKSLERSGLVQYFDATRCVDECRSKPDPQMLLELMQQLGASPERTLLVGDTSHDLQMAKNANVASLAVTYGAHALHHLLPYEPLEHFDDFAELNQWLLING
jgi:phosphoglycolate phosphatase